MFRVIVFFGLMTSAFASQPLDALVNAAASFAVAIQQQLEAIESDSSLVDFARNTIAYAQTKKAYFAALREEMPELINIATGRQARPLELDTIAAVFSIAGERQETIADRETLVLLKRFSGNPAVEKARAEFERAQKLEDQRRWQQRPENQNYFCSPENCQRVKAWRKRNPGYWRKKKSSTQGPLQEVFQRQVAHN
jgi:hypothetical protein